MVDNLIEQFDALSIQEDKILDGGIPKTFLITGSYTYLLLVSDCYQPLIIIDVEKYSRLLDVYIHQGVSLEVILEYYYQLMMDDQEITVMHFLATYFFCGFKINLLIPEDISEFREGRLNIMTWRQALTENIEKRVNVLGTYLDEIVWRKMLDVNNTETFNKPMMIVLKIVYNMLVIDSSDNSSMQGYVDILEKILYLLEISSQPRLLN